MKFSYNKFFFILFLNIVGLVSFSQNKTYVPDDNFEAYLEANGMGDGIGNNDSVNTSSISNVTLLDVSNQNIDSLIGIQDFTAITELNCNNNQLTSLDVSQNTVLSHLNCGGTQLSSLDVTQNLALTNLYCYNNQLSSLDVAQNNALSVLWCYNNQLASLNVTQNTVLTELRCYNNQLSSLDVTQNTALTDLRCYDNPLSSLNITQNTALTKLFCNNNQLSSLDVSQNTALTELKCHNNQLSSLNVSQNTALTQLYCYQQFGSNLGLLGITSLDVSQNTALTVLYCSYNPLTSLDVSQNTSLIRLLCNNTQINSLDVSQNTAITELRCHNNQLSSLDVSQNTALSLLWCNNNQLSSLNVSQNTDLTEFLCKNNLLTTLDLRNGNNLNFTNFFVAHSNPNLYCILVDDANWASANWTVANNNIDAQVSFNNSYPNFSTVADFAVCQGDSIMLYGTSAENLTYNWNNGIVDSTFFVPDSTRSYIVTASDSISCSSTDTVLVNVSIPVTVNDSTFACDSAVWNGNTYVSSGIYTDTLQTIAGCDSIVSLNLIVNNSISTNDSLIVCDSVVWNGITYNSSGIYIDTLQTIVGCDSIVSLNLIVNYSISTVDSLVACDSAVWNGNTYSLGGLYTDTIQTVNGCDSIISLDLTINVSSALSITSNDSLICYGDSVQLIASGAQNYSWQTNYNISSLTIANPMVYPLTDTNYVLTATDTLGCSSSDSILISVIPPYLLNLGGTIDTCIGSIINLQPVLTGGTGNNTTSTWSPGIYFIDSTVLNSTFESNSSVMVYLNVTDTLEGCVVNDSLLINVNNPIADAGFDIDTCVGISLILDGSGAGSGGSYLWTPSNSLNHATIATPLTVLDSTTQFVLQVSDSIGCTDNDTVQISVFSSSYLSDTSLCEGDSLNIELYADSSYNPTFIWTPANGLSNANSSSITIYTDSSTTYSYLATSNNGCTFSDTLRVNVYNAKAIIDTTLLTGCEGVTMLFDNGSDESLDYYWIVDEMDSLFDVSNDLIYNFGDRVDVALFVENSNGCYDSTSMDFYLEGFDEYFKVSLPNVFTPNYDGDNDIFRVDMAGKLNECSELSIFNRWGQLVYSSNGRTPEWNGKNYSGLDVPTGQYYFQLLIKEEPFEGKLYLFR